MSACGNVLCAQYGCQRTARCQPLGGGYVLPQQPIYYPNQTQPAVPLTEADVRRIVREEIAAGREGE
jgi:hypothetical protein